MVSVQTAVRERKPLLPGCWSSSVGSISSLFLWAKTSRGRAASGSCRLTSRSLHFTSRNFPYKNKDPGLISACRVFIPDTYMRARLSALRCRENSPSLGCHLDKRSRSSLFASNSLPFPLRGVLKPSFYGHRDSTQTHTNAHKLTQLWQYSLLYNKSG